MGRALPGGVGFAFELATPKKHNIWKKPLCTWYSGFFHCEKIRDSGRGKHHVEDLRHRIPAERSSAASDVVPHSPQTLVLSSTNTTSLGPKAPAAYRTWCLTPRKPLFFRPQAPRLSGQRRRRRTGRGAPSPAIPCFFVRKHHVPRSGWTDAGTDVVLHPPQSLIPSSRGTTSPSPDGIGKGSADEFAIRLHFLPLLFCIDRKSSGAIAPLLFLHNPIKFYYFTFPLLFGAV